MDKPALKKRLQEVRAVCWDAKICGLVARAVQDKAVKRK